MNEDNCRGDLVLGVMQVIHCDREYGHGGMHHFEGTSQALDGVERNIVVSWSDGRVGYEQTRGAAPIEAGALSAVDAIRRLRDSE